MSNHKNSLLLRALALLILVTLGTLLVPHSTGAKLPMVATDERWIRVDTPYFILYSHTDKGTASRLARDLLRLIAVLEYASEGLEKRPNEETCIFLFRNLDFFNPYNQPGKKPSENLLGYFLPGERVQYLAFADVWTVGRRSILFHEFTHSILYTNLPTAPLWLHEGLASFYGAIVTRKTTARVGKPIAEYVYHLSQEPMYGIEELITIDQSSLSFRPGTFYAQSWLLVHMLLRAATPETQNAFSEFLTSLKSGMDPTTSFIRCYNWTSPDSLQAQLEEYSERRTFDVVEYNLQENLDEIEVRAESVDRKELLSRLGDLLLSHEDPDLKTVREHFEVVLDEDPKYGPALIGLGRVEELEGNPAEADRRLALAMKVDPSDPVAPYIAGKLLFARHTKAAVSAAGDESNNLTRAREMLNRSLLLDRTHAETLALYGMTFLYAPPDSVHQGLSALTESFEKMPGRLDVLVALLGISARVGNRSGVEWLLERGENNLAGREAEAESLLTTMFADEQDADARAGLEDVVADLQKMYSNRIYDNGVIALARDNCELAFLCFLQVSLGEDEELRPQAVAMMLEAQKCLSDEE